MKNEIQIAFDGPDGNKFDIYAAKTSGEYSEHADWAGFIWMSQKP